MRLKLFLAFTLIVLVSVSLVALIARRGAGNRHVKINPTLNRYQELARQKLVSEQGRRLRSRRGVEVDSVFGRIKQDWGFRRFTLGEWKK
jgi:hypothetical protein